MKNEAQMPNLIANLHQNIISSQQLTSKSIWICALVLKIQRLQQLRQMQAAQQTHKHNVSRKDIFLKQSYGIQDLLKRLNPSKIGSRNFPPIDFLKLEESKYRKTVFFLNYIKFKFLYLFGIKKCSKRKSITNFIIYANKPRIMIQIIL